jgi:hypothetical protein
MGKGKRRENDQEEKEKMAMRVTRKVVFGLQVAPPPLSSALQSPLYSNEPIDDCQQLSACDGSACFLN